MSKSQILLLCATLVLSADSVGQSRKQCEHWSEQFQRLRELRRGRQRRRNGSLARPATPYPRRDAESAVYATIPHYRFGQPGAIEHKLGLH